MDCIQIACHSENIAPAVGFARIWAQTQGLEPADADRWALAIDELLTNIVLFAFQETDQPPNLELQFQVQMGLLELIVHEPGEPFDPESHIYEPEAAISRNHFEGSGLHLIQCLTDGFTYLNKGRSGKEFRLVKKIPYAHVQELPSVSENPLTPEKVEDLSLRPVTPADAEELARLIYRTYGHSYPKEEMYYPQKIAGALKKKQKFGVICVNSKGHAIGYLAVIKTRNTRIGEVAEAVVAPAYRGQGIMTHMMQELLKLAQQQSLHGVFGEAITIHKVSQKVNAKFHFVSTALLLNTFPQVKSKGFSNQQERLSVLIEFLPFVRPEKRALFFPRHLRHLILTIYQHLQIEVLEGKEPKKPEALLPAQTQIEAHLGYKYQLALLVLSRCGTDLAEAVQNRCKSLRKKGFVTFHVDIPLAQSWAPWAVQTLQKEGFFLAGLFPMAHQEQDYLRLQDIDNPLQMRQIQIHSDLGLQIRKKVVSEYRRWKKT